MVPEGWLIHNLGDLVTFARGGTSFLKTEYTDTGTPVLTKGDVRPMGRVHHSGRWANTQAALAKKYYFTQPGDLLVTTRDLTQAADFLGLVSPVPTDQPYLVNQGATVFRLDEKRIDPRFFVYWTAGGIYRQHIKNHHVGSTQIHLRQADLYSAPVWLPPFPEQEQIADALSALDQKIDLNNALGRSLERFGRMIFNSWFKNFEPVKAKIAGETNFPGMRSEIFDALPERLVPTPYGDIPDGWKIATLADLVVEKKLRVNPSVETRESPYVPIDSISAHSLWLESTRNGVEAQTSLVQFSKDDILFGAMRPYFHKVCVAPCDGTTRTTVFVLRVLQHDDLSFAALLLSDKDTIDYATAHSVGSTIPYAKWSGSLARMPVIIPPVSLRQAFHSIFQPAIQKGQQSLSENTALMAVRDAVLPRLLRGELRLCESR